MNDCKIRSFQRMIDVNIPIIYIHDYDFVRIDELILQVTANKKVFEWNPATGSTDFHTKAKKGFGGDTLSLESFLRRKYVFFISD